MFAINQINLTMGFHFNVKVNFLFVINLKIVHINVVYVIWDKIIVVNVKVRE